jgi:hypothetical protein
LFGLNSLSLSLTINKGSALKPERMNFKILFFMFVFGLIGLTTTSSAQTIFEEIDLLQGEVLPIQLTSQVVPPQLKSDPVEGNIVEQEPSNGPDYVLNYIPDSSFLGSDGFAVEVITSFNYSDPAASIKKTYVFLINIQASMVETNDDFVHLTSQDEVVIDVLANDETSSSDLTVTLAQVLKGTAIVNGDQTISYTPNGDDPDYIVYSVTDDFNTISSSTIYLTQESETTEEFTIKEYTIASGNSQYIILPNDDFTLVTEDFDFGEVEQINSFVYKYSSEENSGGFELVEFTDSDENIHHATIDIIEKYTDVGFVKDDLFYSASNTNIIFDVSLNDIYDQYVISDYSEELTYIGSGEFSYTPTPYYSGVKKFTYTADDGFTEEIGEIELVISNFKPTNYFDYNFSTPENQPRIVEYNVPLGTEFFGIVSLPDHGSIEIFTEDESVDLGCDEGIQKVFAVYTPDEDYVGMDDFTIKYCASDNNLCNNISILVETVENDLEACICVDDCVWPGDANGDGKVSVVDALSIGRFIGNGGAAREDSPFGDIYEGSSADDWSTTQVNGKNLKHADANGDGYITSEDLDVVIDNYGEINSVISADILGVKNLPFLLTTDATDIDSGDWLVLNVILGDDDFPAIDLHGVAFAVNLPASLVDSASVEVEYLESGYFVKDAPYVSLTHQPTDGIIHTAGTKSNAVGSTGAGIIATVSFIVEEDAEGFKDDKRSFAERIGDIVATISITDIIIEDSRGFKYSLPNSSLDIVVNSGEDESSEVLTDLSVYPNPAKDIVTVATKNGTKFTSIDVYSMEGQLVKSIANLNETEAQIQINGLTKGLYILQASTSTSTYSTKLFIK